MERVSQETQALPYALPRDRANGVQVLLRVQAVALE